MFEVGEKVVILKSDYSSLIGKTAIVMQNDVINGIKVKVSFDEKWQGYYLPSELAKYSDFIKNENTTLFVNLFGAPGAGKSTGATYVFFSTQTARHRFRIYRRVCQRQMLGEK